MQAAAKSPVCLRQVFQPEKLTPCADHALGAIVLLIILLR
jgi:hypothetical protein